MSDDDLKRIETKLDAVLDGLSTLRALNDLLVEADYVTKAKRLNKNTISQNKSLDKFNAPGKRKTLITIESVAAIRNRRSEPK